MPRRYYSKRTKVIRPKKKWASNITQLVGAQYAEVSVVPASTASYTHHFLTFSLCQNKVQQNPPTPTILKCGNFKLKGDMRLQFGSNSTLNNGLAGVTAYIVYVPEGMPVNSSLITNHPEWIMAWSPLNVDMSYFSQNTSLTSNLEKFSMSSRLKRNLNSGDQIYLLVDIMLVPSGGQTAPVTVNINYTPCIGVQYWTCAN